MTDTVARLISAEEAIEDGDPSLAWAILRDLEDELRADAADDEEAA